MFSCVSKIIVHLENTLKTTSGAREMAQLVNGLLSRPVALSSGPSILIETWAPTVSGLGRQRRGHPLLGLAASQSSRISELQVQ